jgi:hypothetical protein
VVVQATAVGLVSATVAAGLAMPAERPAMLAVDMPSQVVELPTRWPGVALVDSTAVAVAGSTAAVVAVGSTVVVAVVDTGKI